ncbi:MAG: inositol monophosphatase family protein [Verrucomicrobiota bacterium]
MLESLQQIVREAGDISLNYFEKITHQQISYKGDVDLLTVADQEVENFLRRELYEKFPDVSFIGEESINEAPLEYDQAFIVDPIDGTSNFVHALPQYAVSVAFVRNNSTELGIVYIPCSNEMYYARRGQGAYKNGTAIHVSSTHKLIHALVFTGFACVRERFTPDNMELFEKIVYQIRGVRISGSAASDCCTVAEGKADIYWELNLKPWDVAAGALIIEEAGGTVTDLSGNQDYDPTTSFLATNSNLHRAFLELACD